MRVRFRSEALADVESAFAWYEDQRPGLGVEFRIALEAVVERVADGPSAFTEVLPPVRRALLRRFPYSLYFRVLEGESEGRACLHMRRNPDAWLRRG